MICRVALFILLSALTVPLASRAMTLEEFLSAVAKKHGGIQAIQESREASDARRDSGDIEFAPALSLKGSYLEDKKQPNQFGASETKVQTATLGFGKKFSSGTSLGLSASSTAMENPDLANPLFAQGSLGVSISQSLWKDAFGHGTSLRHERERLVNRTERAGLDLQERQLYVNAEIAFWDYLYAKESLEIRKASMNRAKRIENWVSRRVNDGIGDSADLYNARALVASRNLQLQLAEDAQTTAANKLRDFLELPYAEPLPEMQGDFTVARAPTNLVGGGNGRIWRLDSYLAFLEAKTRGVVADEVNEGTKADLVLAGQYNTNSFEQGGKLSDGTRNWTKTDTPTTAVSLSWTYLFDTGGKGSTLESARKEAAAAKLRAERSRLESESAWSELNRRHGELSRKVQSAEQISKLQAARARAEQDKLSKGRSITANVITAEQEAAEAELSWTLLRSEQRKLEASSRLFVSVKEEK